MPFSTTADFARRTTPAPKSTRYGVSLTTTAVAGPERSGSAGGLPVPSRTTRVPPDAGDGGWRHAAGFIATTTIAIATTPNLSPGELRHLPNVRVVVVLFIGFDLPR